MDTEPKLQEGIALHQNGQLQPAELIYQQILQVNPQNAEVLHLLGTIAHQVEKYDLAINLINQAIEIDPNRSSFFNNLGRLEWLRLIYFVLAVKDQGYSRILRILNLVQ